MNAPMKTLIFAAMGLLLGLLSACSDPPAAPGDDTPACEQGVLGCPCNNDGSCAEGAECQAGFCRESICPEGFERCPCYSNMTCNDGLLCDGGTCIPGEVCEPGERSCPCEEGDACLDGLTCMSGTCIEEVGCTPGAIGCDCLAGTCTAEDAFCDDEQRCQLTGCPEGEEDCACGLGGTCSDTGDPLTCEAGICVPLDCDPGETACICRDGADCDSPEDTCEDGFCLPAGCVEGEENCGCIGGVGCGQGLVCVNGSICQDNTGHTGGACLEDGTCNRGNACERGVCQPCRFGTLGCDCDDADNCSGNGVVCFEGTCRDEDEVGELPPDDPLCYVPCTDNVVDSDNNPVFCSSDKLREGCLNNQVCDVGSCVLEGDEDGLPNLCENDRECAPWQACIQGGCYSNCTANTECGLGEICHHRVCRATCNNIEPCEQGYSCDILDGDNGVCVLQAEPPTEVQTVQESRLVVDFIDSNGDLIENTLKFSNIFTSQTFKLTNDSAVGRTVRFRKLSHTVVYGEDNTESLTDPDDDEECQPNCPLFWLEIGKRRQTQRAQEVELDLDPFEEVELEVSGAGDVESVRWQGVLEIVSDDSNAVQIPMRFVDRPDGQWTGNAYYFGTFGTGGLYNDPEEEELGWLDLPNPTDQDTNGTRDDTRADVGNAFIQRWSDFRRGGMGMIEFRAMLTATRDETWRQRGVMDACNDAACYMYTGNQRGVETFSSNLETRPIPSGVISLPVAFNLTFDDPNDLSHMSGRIESSASLHYAGNPSIDLTFTTDATGCTREVRRNNATTCLTFLEDLSADIVVGGRHEAGPGTVCPPNFELKEVPWLVPGFLRNTNYDEETSLNYRYECRDTRLPFTTNDPDEQELFEPINLALASANPIPDGKPRLRQLRLVDGALIDQSTLFIIFEESFDSFLGPTDTEGFKAYGFMLLERSGADLDTTDTNDNGTPDVFEGAVPELPDTDLNEDPLEVTCSEDLLREVLTGESGFTLNSDNADHVVTALIDGVGEEVEADLIDSDEEFIHYLCSDTGNFDGGRDFGEFCPPESNVIYFTTSAELARDRALNNHSCQGRPPNPNDPLDEGTLGTCGAVLQNWNSNNQLIQYEPRWRCTNNNEVFCSNNRADLREGKDFYAAPEDIFVANGIGNEIEAAFRYKIRFKNRQGQGIGFAPEICLDGSDQIPYCYEPAKIEAVRERVDCLLHIWENRLDDLLPHNRDTLIRYLRTNFSYTETRQNDLPLPIIDDGFERLHAELLVMMGDESYTNAFASRFDLAQINIVSFEGSLFEEGGLNLSGVAGFEMHSLYQAVQYYQESLDRFYALAPLFWRSIQYSADPDSDDYDPGRDFVTQETVVAWIDRLVRASSQRTRALSEISRRYLLFNEPELARRVVERSYASAYLESKIMNRMMDEIGKVLAPNARAQINRIINQAQLRYSMAMLDMREVYTSITDEVTNFGIPPGFIPFPTVDVRETNAFEQILGRVQTKIQLARERENLAIESNRSFETDAAQFQSELVRIRNTYEAQLGDLCGTFEHEGRIYPATQKYIHIEPYGGDLGDPCGFTGHGEIFEAMARFEQYALDAEKIKVQMENVLESVSIEQQRVADQCDLIDERAGYAYRRAGEIINYNTAISSGRATISALDRASGVASTLAFMTKCSAADGECAASAIGATAFTLASSTIIASAAALDAGIISLERDIADIERETARWETRQECDVALTDSNARTMEMLLSLEEFKVEALRAQYQISLGLSEVQKLRNKAQRLQQEQRETEQLTINVESARNDPNIRIYKNDAIINADFSFQDAIREVYRATLVFEYYTSQSYERKGQLFLIRMISRGDYNLENYVTDLQNAFFEFEDDFGLPETRVLRLSLIDDIFAIPRLDEDGLPLDPDEREAMLHERLRDPALLDRNGYLTIPFGTGLDRLSPATRNHKVLFIKANLSGTGLGDDIARIYLRQRGTSVINSLYGERIYYRFPPRLAVINPTIDGTQIFDPDVYKTLRMRDRPLANTHWELIINQRDEFENQDLNLQGLTDIKLYIYYSDFTEL